MRPQDSATTDRTAPQDLPSIIRPYGDTTGDAMVQLSFSLPVPAGKRAELAALQLAGKMGLDPASVVHSKPMGPNFTFFIVYGKVNHLIDYAGIEVPEGREYPLLSAKEIDLAIRTVLNRRMVVVGACIGTDAHTVGIDAILNVKGFAGEKGLEYHREIQVINMGAQVTVEELVERAKAENADAVLVSQVVTQKNAHIHNTKQMAAAFHAAYPTAVGPGMGRPLLIAGGPRFDTVTEQELGVDRIFGKGTTPREVASYLVHALLPSWTPENPPENA
ncbi:lysine 5,6-aminomutase subunit beta [Actinoallomurus rhizosphaericola]|uniref:lysine 5,6-aminomutase subunit beta n=1 Tax=Actinoallomurus rhizosphaericola TaxID=2952536 RepID=UPI00209318DB|nr:OAM dimerization domain-containing protein [Actinoallomurus rhizosphaericola]MCO5997065.1 cobalamin-dependent protein [Actinoallomurus rhizosphaericola]